MLQNSTGRVLVEGFEEASDKHSNTYTYQSVLAYPQSFLCTSVSLLTLRTSDQYRATSRIQGHF